MSSFKSSGNIQKRESGPYRGLDVKNTNPEWYNEGENYVNKTIENNKKNIENTVINEDFENQDIYLEEVTRANRQNQSLIRAEPRGKSILNTD